MSSLMTGWYPPDMKPARIGFYDVNGTRPMKTSKPLPVRGYWDGNRWHYPMEGHVPHFQDFYWRGLAADGARHG